MLKNRKDSGKEEYLKISLVNQKLFAKDDKTDPLWNVSDSDIDYKNIPLLLNFITARGKIVSGRLTGVPLKKQRRLSKAIKRARILALLSFIAKVE